MAARKMCFVFLGKKRLCTSIVSLTNSSVKRDRQRGRDDPSFVTSQQFKLHRFCFFGQDRRLWESKLRVTLQVRPVWDTSGGSVAQGAAVLWDLSGSHFKRQEERSLVSGILFPRQWAAFLTSSELVKHHRRFFLLSWENHNSNLMLPPLNLWQADRVSPLPLRHFLFPWWQIQAALHTRPWWRRPHKARPICQRRAKSTRVQGTGASSRH